MDRELCFLIITCNLWVGSGRVETGLWSRSKGVDVGVRRGVCARVRRYFRTFLLEGVCGVPFWAFCGFGLVVAE